MRLFGIFITVLSIGLFAYILRFAESTTILSEVIAIGIWGVVVVFSVYLLASVIDSITWHLAMTPLPFALPCLYRSWRVRMVGEACNVVLPVGGIGGEPVKAALMKNHGLDYHESITSLIIAKTVNMIALVFFLGVGFGLILLRPSPPTSLIILVGVGFIIFAMAIFTFFIIQRWRIASRIGEYLSQARIGYRTKAILRCIESVDNCLVVFYTRWRTRFVLAVILAIGSWSLCALETYCAARFLGLQIDFSDAWIVEAMVQIVRAGSFFIPASVGVQEGIFLVAFAAFGISASGAMAVALLKRGREITWIAWGGMLGISHLMPLSRKGEKGYIYNALFL